MTTSIRFHKYKKQQCAESLSESFGPFFSIRQRHRRIRATTKNFLRQTSCGHVRMVRIPCALFRARSVTNASMPRLLAEKSDCAGSAVQISIGQKHPPERPPFRLAFQRSRCSHHAKSSRGVFCVPLPGLHWAGQVRPSLLLQPKQYSKKRVRRQRHTRFFTQFYRRDRPPLPRKNLACLSADRVL